MRAGGALLVPLALCCAGCARYADFSLPSVAGGDPAFRYAFEPRPAPVLERGASGEWDSVDVLNPSVVRAGGQLLNLYSGFDGRVWRTGLATSDDGVNWRKRGMAIAPDPARWEGRYIAANGALASFGGGFLYWYQAGAKDVPRIGLARSPDGAVWSKLPRPVLDTGPSGSWDERAVADPYVIRAEPYFYMYYLGQDRARRQRLGVARSFDGVQWEKLRSSPVLELGGPGSFDEGGLGEPAVWRAQGFYWMLYTGRDLAENRRLGMARSTDGVRWEKLPEVFGGFAPWSAKVVCDPTMEVADGAVRVWFGAGDAASPDENLNGQVGLAILRPASATLAK